METQNCTFEFFSSEVARITFQLFVKVSLFSNCVLNNRLFLVPFGNKVFQGNLWQTKNLGEVCVLLIRKFRDMLLLDLE